MAGKDKDVIHDMYNRTTFVKVKQWLSAGKIVFSFVDMEKKNPAIECYLDAEEFGALLMQDIRTGVFLRKLEKSKADAAAAGRQYPESVFTSPVGGTDRGQHGAVSRYFTISPGSRAEVVITGLMYPAEKNETGAFISKKGAKALSIIRVSCSYADLRLLQYKWSFLEQDYMPKKYNMETMKSDYTRNIDEHETYSQQTQPYEPVPEEPVQQQPSTTTRQPQEDKTEIVEFACVAKGQVTTHANGMRHVQIYDPIKRSVFGKLYIRDEDYGDIRDGQQMRIRAQKKNNDYLFVANV